MFTINELMDLTNDELNSVNSNTIKLLIKDSLLAKDFLLIKELTN
jgi:hypothetical protein